MNINRFNILFFVLPLILILGLGAQTTVILMGTVNSQGGGPVPSAAVTVTPISGGASQKVLTGPDGTFNISGLPPGSYRVDVEFTGYKRASVLNYDLTTGTAPAIRIVLEPGSVQDTVDIQATAVLVQTDSAQISHAFAERNIRETPISDRNHEELVQLVPGITPPRATESRLMDPQRSRLWETNGLPSSANYKTLDGVPNTEAFTGAAVYVAPVEAAQQFHLITSNHEAQYGRGAGSVLNPVTRQGTNEVHGSLFEFNTNSALAARNFFNPKGYPQAKSNINQFGGSVGGPIRHDTTFFLINYEGITNRSQTPAVSTVPTAEFRSGDFRGVPGLTIFDPATGSPAGIGRMPFPNNMIPSVRFSTPAQAILSNIQQPNAAGFENNLVSNVPYRDNGHRGDVRFDHKASDNTNLFLRWSHANYVPSEGSVLGSLAGGNGHLQNHQALIGASHSFSPSTVMDLRLNYTRYSNKLNNTASGLTPGALGFIDPSSTQLAAIGLADPGLPQINITGMQSFGTPPNLPETNVNNNFNVANGWSLITGRNTIHAGFDVWHVRANGFLQNPYGPAGGYLFAPGATASPTGEGLGPFGTFANSFASFLLGTPAQAGRAVPYWNPSYTQWQSALYLSDTLKVSSRLTVNIGARWDVFTPVKPRSSLGVFIYDRSSNQLLPTNQNGVDEVGNRETKWANIAPRVGFAYRLMDSTVVRAGYGMNYFYGPLNFWAGSLLTNVGAASGGIPGGFAAARGATLGQLPPIPSTSFATATTALPAPNAPMIYSPTDARTPVVHNYDFQIQHDVGRYGLVASIGYVGNLGRQLSYSREINAAAPGTGEQGQPLNAQFGRTASTIERGTGLTSNYNSLQASLNKRFGESLSFTGAYTYSRSLDHGTGGVVPLLNNSSFQANYGPSDWDRTHMFTMSHLWELPFGATKHFLNEGIVGRILGPWQLNGVFRWVSGTPFTVTADPALCNCPGNTPTASTVVTGVNTSIVPAPTFFGFLPVAYQSLNFAFTQPPPGTLGNLGRNSVRGASFANYDLSLFRSFVIQEQTKLEFRAEAYNISNSPHFANPITNVNSANFGQSVGTLPYAPERRLQLALRLVF